MYKRTVYLVFGKNYLAFGKGKKSQVMKRVPKSQLKKNPHSSITNPFPCANLWYERWLIRGEMLCRITLGLQLILFRYIIIAVTFVRAPFMDLTGGRGGR